MKVIFATALIVGVNAYYSQSRSDCQKFVKLFSNTCDVDTWVDDWSGDGEDDQNAFNWSTHIGPTRTCSGVEQICKESTLVTDSDCQHVPKLCVTCYSDINDITRIQVRTNGLPNHCYRQFTSSDEGLNDDTYYVSPTDVDFDVIWNRDVLEESNSSITEENTDTSEKATSLLCATDGLDTSNMLSGTGYVNNAGGDAQLVGVALDGVRFGYPYQSINGSTRNWLNKYTKADACLTYVDGDDQLFYPMMSPCLKSSSTTVTPGLCKDDDTCDAQDGPWALATSIFSATSNHGGVIGIAKDGHPIYGPYNDDGETWICDEHDICNGVFLEGNKYAYVATPTFPYIMGCFGPSVIQYYPISGECSNDSCSAIAGLSVATALAGALFALMHF